MVDSAGRLLRRLLPFPSSGEPSSLALPAMPAYQGLTRAAATPSMVSAAAEQLTAGIVSEAASILDAEMARGVLAARNASYPARVGASDPGPAFLRQLHDFIDQAAAAWPSLQGAFRPGAGGSRSTDTGAADGPLPELKPAAAVRAGKPATISMVVVNKEDHAVCLAPVSTDLLSGAGGRIPANAIEFVPKELWLDPGARGDLQIKLVIPAASAPGCYYGLLIVSGADDLRALTAIEVV
jgi:hypothetical protein